MKNFTFILLFCSLFQFSGFTQNSIQLNINHKLGDADFAMNTPAQNNLNDDFEVSRMEYYISEIAITHDGGTETAIDNVWILVNADEPTQVDLGNYDIDMVEKVSFYVGVDPDHNHLDPSSYQSAHPLAPKFPSMHWGWTSGYRFVAFEGNGGSSFNQPFQLHGLEDENYFQTEIELTTAAENNEVIINLDADYARALENINVAAGVIVHGGYAEAKQCLENFRDYVFSPASTATSTVDLSEITGFDIYPNPVTTGFFTINLDADSEDTYQVSITNVLGKQIRFIQGFDSNTTVEIPLSQTGIYFVSLIKEGQSVMTKKLIFN